ncbi:MAG: RidA family protein [Candidatus Neomarinimicrobiota bacterium]
MNKSPLPATVALVFLCGCGSPDAEPGLRASYFTAESNKQFNLPFSDVARVGNLLFLSGHLGVEPGTDSLVPGGIAAETRQALENIKRTLETNESSLDRVFKCTVMLADIGEWEPMSAVYGDYLPHKPARSTFGTGGLALGARVEIECIATVR